MRTFNLHNIKIMSTHPNNTSTDEPADHIDPSVELSEDELEAVAGGTLVPESFVKWVAEKVVAPVAVAIAVATSDG